MKHIEKSKTMGRRQTGELLKLPNINVRKLEQVYFSTVRAHMLNMARNCVVGNERESYTAYKTCF